jgi:hypothetical protein
MILIILFQVSRERRRGRALLVRSLSSSPPKPPKGPSPCPHHHLLLLLTARLPRVEEGEEGEADGATTCHQTIARPT